MKKLKIAHIAPLWVSVPPKTFGGTETVVYDLVEGLVKKGHDITLFASADSKVSAKLKSFIDVSLNEHWKSDIRKKLAYTPKGKLYCDLGNHLEVFLRQEKFDIIHSHFGPAAIFFGPFLKTPLVITQHIPFPDKDKPDLFKCFSSYNKYAHFVPISKNQLKVAGYKIGQAEKVIYNGANVGKYRFNLKPKDYFAFLGRIMPVKGTLDAVRAAKKAKAKLKIAGSVDDFRYFKKVKKYITGKNIQYIREVNHREKNILLRNAKALLFPISWEEPFGLVMVEAMACGTPVIAFDRGSVCEVVDHGRTGFIVNNVREMVQAMKKIDQIDRSECRKEVEKRFSTEKMVEDYENLYYDILKRKKSGR